MFGICTFPYHQWGKKNAITECLLISECVYECVCAYSLLWNSLFSPEPWSEILCFCTHLLLMIRCHKDKTTYAGHKPWRQIISNKKSSKISCFMSYFNADHAGAYGSTFHVKAKPCILEFMRKQETELCMNPQHLWRTNWKKYERTLQRDSSVRWKSHTQSVFKLKVPLQTHGSPHACRANMNQVTWQ